MEKEYEGSCYLAVVGPESDPGVCRDSIHMIQQRPGDIGPNWCRATKGYEARQAHLNKFIDTTACSFILFLDHDMVFQPDTLERLRSHKLPYVSGLYMRRQYQPIAPIWFRPFDGKLPLVPWGGPIDRGKLHEIGAAGWGCTLVHREVIMKVRELLHGEQDIIEDDMDLWPYDLIKVFGAIHGLRTILDEKPARSTLIPALEAHTKTLEVQLRPLTAAKHTVFGSDIRYPFYALAAGYKFYGDPDVRCGHLLNYPLSPDDYDGLGIDNQNKLKENIDRRTYEEQNKLHDAYREVTSA